MSVRNGKSDYLEKKGTLMDYNLSTVTLLYAVKKRYLVKKNLKVKVDLMPT